MTGAPSLAKKVRLFAAVMLLISSRYGRAQTNAEVDPGLQFHFSSPGARSLGMGGAFIGLADDATAAYTNPAGLVILSKPEVSAEGQRSSYTNQFTDRGHALGTPSGVGLDNVNGLVRGASKDEVDALSFASFVYPRGSWAVAVYRQDLADFGASFKTQGAFVAFLRLLPTSDALSMQIVNEGVSGAFRVTDSLSIGIGLSEYHFNLRSLTNRYSLQDFYGPPDYAAQNVAAFETLSGSDDDVAVNAGLLWEISRSWRAGVVYREGPRFNFRTTSQAGPASGFAGTVFANNRATFHVPDFYGAGIAYQPTEYWTISAEYDRIQYSELTRGSTDIYDPMSMPDPSIKQLVVNDANELHLGIEHVWTDQKYPLVQFPPALALRLGGWTDPDHSTRFVGAPDAHDIEAEFLSALFLRGNNEIHVTGGLGLIFRKWELNIAYDYAKLVRVGSLSGVFRF